jgi:serine/threonine protein kinase
MSDPKESGQRELPKSIGKYEVLRHLAWGGMAEVLLARVSGADGFSREVVIKRILPQHSENAEFVRMFRDEARITAQLTHGNIVQVIEFGEDAGSHYLVLEYVRGASLAALLSSLRARGERLGVAEVAHVGCELARALDYAHRKRGSDGAPLMIVHRDVSPSNVLVSHEGEVKLVDFGVARARARLSPTAHGVGTVKGKLSYLAPEMLDGRVDARSDLFAMGLVLHEMLTGRQLFSGANEAEVIYRVMSAPIPAPSMLAPGLPPEVDAIVAKLLMRDPNARPARASEVVEALTPVVSTKGQPASERLAQRLEELGLSVVGGAPATQGTPSGAPSLPRVLVVDQSRTMRAILRKMIEPLYRVVEATSGEEAIAIAHDTPPDAVVCQAVLPGQSGTTLCQTLRAAPALKGLPFVLLASDPHPAMVLEARRMGVADVLPKQVERHKLLGVLEALVPPRGRT